MGAIVPVFLMVIILLFDHNWSNLQATYYLTNFCLFFSSPNGISLQNGDHFDN